MATLIHWQKRCLDCGKTESAGSNTTPGKPPSGGNPTPFISGRCPNNPSGKHNAVLAEKYMGRLGAEFSKLSKIKLADSKVMEYIEMLLPMDDNPSPIHQKNITQVREDLKMRYFDAPDLRHVGKNAYRFICAVSDFATHAKPLRETANYRENLFARTIEGNTMIDKSYEIVQAAA